LNFSVFNLIFYLKDSQIVHLQKDYLRLWVQKESKKMEKIMNDELFAKLKDLDIEKGIKIA